MWLLSEWCKKVYRCSNKSKKVWLLCKVELLLHSDMARILAIDYGKKRTGLAVTDPMQIIANGLTTVATSELEAYILDYASREELECIVVGKPTQNSGEVSENMRRIEPFVNRLQKLLPHIPVEYCDERFTSLLAHQAMLDGGLHKKERQNKALVDEISATIILQSYMDARRITAARRNEEKMSE